MSVKMEKIPLKSLRDKMRELYEEKDGEKKFPEKIDGVVMQTAVGGSPRQIGFVVGDRAYQNVIGGTPRAIGYVENGIVYESVIGGKPRAIGKVKTSTSSNQA